MINVSAYEHEVNVRVVDDMITKLVGKNADVGFPQKIFEALRSRAMFEVYYRIKFQSTPVGERK